MEEELKSVFHYFRKDFSKLYPIDGASKNIVRPTDVYCKKTLLLNRKLGIHKINKKQNDKVRKVSRRF